MKVVLSCLVILLLSSCGSLFGRGWGVFNPRPPLVDMPEGDDDFSVGFRDGCQTGSGIIGESVMRVYGMSYDVEKGIENQQYYKGYKTGFNTCVFVFSHGIN